MRLDSCNLKLRMRWPGNKQTGWFCFCNKCQTMENEKFYVTWSDRDKCFLCTHYFHLDLLSNVVAVRKRNHFKFLEWQNQTINIVHFFHHGKKPPRLQEISSRFATKLNHFNGVHEIYFSLIFLFFPLIVISLFVRKVRKALRHIKA